MELLFCSAYCRSNCLPAGSKRFVAAPKIKFRDKDPRDSHTKEARELRADNAILRPDMNQIRYSEAVNLLYV